MYVCTLCWLSVQHMRANQQKLCRCCDPLQYKYEEKKKNRNHRITTRPHFIFFFFFLFFKICIANVFYVYYLFYFIYRCISIYFFKLILI